MIARDILEWFIPSLKEAVKVKGDVEGHEFHGNQYSGGNGGSSDGGSDGGGDSSSGDGGSSASHLVSSGESAKLNAREKRAIKEIPTSRNSEPSSYEVLNDGKVAYFHRIGVPSEIKNQQTGNVIRGKSGKYYATRGSDVFEVANVKPYLGKWMNPKNSYTNAEK